MARRLMGRRHPAKWHDAKSISEKAQLHERHPITRHSIGTPAALLIQEIAGGVISSAVTDLYPNPVSPFVFDVDCKSVQRLIGKEIPVQEIKEIILALGIVITSEKDAVFSVEVPAYKVDVTREVDVTEEVLRIYGYNNIELKSQVLASLNTQDKPDKEVVLNQVADLLIGNGYREILSNSLTKLSYVDDESTAVRLLNPLSSDLDTMRQNLVYSMLTAMARARSASDMLRIDSASSPITPSGSIP